jgi:hypothetical protein
MHRIEITCESVDWIWVADKVQWLTFVSTMMNVLVL